jgi:hypothetical protein
MISYIYIDGDIRNNCCCSISYWNDDNRTAQSANVACDNSGNTPYGQGRIEQESNPNLNSGGNTDQSGFGGAISNLAKNSDGLQYYLIPL